MDRATCCPECGSTLVDYDGQLDDAADFVHWDDVERLKVRMNCDTCGIRYVSVYTFTGHELKGRRIA